MTSTKRTKKRIRFSPDSNNSHINTQCTPDLGIKDALIAGTGISSQSSTTSFSKIPLVSPLLRLMLYTIVTTLSVLFIFIRICARIKCIIANMMISVKIKKKSNIAENLNDKTILVLHPNAINNGGGEKVLWHILSDIPSSKYNIRIFSSDSEKKQSQWRNLISQYFGIRTTQIRRLEFVNVENTHRFVEKSAKWPFTLFVQSLISMIGFSYSLLWNSKSGDILLDTTGFSFVYPLAYAMGLKVVAYVHYPTISTDMFQLVQRRRNNYNNSIQQSILKTYVKLIYYCIFAMLYGLVGSYCDVVFVNSSWTHSHITSLWGSIRSKIHIVYPPVNVSSLKNIPLDFEKREKIILSVGQFRPEKNHPLQLLIFAEFLKKYPDLASEYKLVLLGSCRHDEDRARVEMLKQFAKDLNLERNHVEFIVDAPYNTLQYYLSKSFIGLHCMENEHFGICVVEYQAAGLITLAHNSAGPKMDIVTEYNGKPTGFLASSKDEYVEALYEITSHFGEPSLSKIQANARESTRRFSSASFSEKLSPFLQPIGIESLKTIKSSRVM